MATASEQMRIAMDKLVEQASEGAIDHDLQELQVFASQLRGLGDTENDDESMSLLPALRVPGGFRHARYTIYEVVEIGPQGELFLGQPKHAGEIIDSKLDPLDLRTLVRTASVLSRGTESTSMGPGRWLESFALPIRNPGMLELALVVEPREVNDGSFTARIQAAIRMVKERRPRTPPV